jgi:hypothetical protein
MSEAWIHSRRGQRLVDGTLPRLAAALEGLSERLDKLEQREAAQPAPAAPTHYPAWREWEAHRCGITLDELFERLRSEERDPVELLLKWLHGDTSEAAIELHRLAILAAGYEVGSTGYVLLALDLRHAVEDKSLMATLAPFYKVWGGSDPGGEELLHNLFGDYQIAIVLAEEFSA